MSNSMLVLKLVDSYLLLLMLAIGEHERVRLLSVACA